MALALNGFILSAGGERTTLGHTLTHSNGTHTTLGEPVLGDLGDGVVVMAGGQLVVILPG